jgi:hypothetical protein
MYIRGFDPPRAMHPTLKKILLIAAEVALVGVILALIAANWIPVVIGAHPTHPTGASRSQR